MSTFLKSCSKFERMLFLYISLFGLHGILVLPLIGNKAQLSDLLFPDLASYIYQENKDRIREVAIPKWPLIGLAVILDIGLISAVLNYNLNTLLESVARYYLFLLAAMVFVHFYFKKPAFRFELFKYAFVTAAVCGSIIGLGGVALQYIGIENQAALFYPDFPYIGDTYRLTAFFAAPNMLVLLFGLAISFLLEDRSSRYLKTATIIITVGLAFTFAKGLLLILPLVLRPYIVNKNKWLRPIVWTPFIIAFILLSHLQFKSIDGNPNTMYGSDDSIYKTESLQILKTSYTTNKETALAAFQTAPLFGLGNGNFNAFVDQRKQVGKYPLHYYSYDPHSTWFGTLAELGIFAFLALCIFTFYLIANSRKLDRSVHINKVLLGFFLILLIESISMDMLNFRFLYILLGLFILQIESHRKKETSVH